MPPCGVPSLGIKVFPWSRIPASNQAFICLLALGKVLTFLSSFFWFMRSKHLLMSASNTYLDLNLIALKMLPIAS